jgi:hypothetical protein
MVQGTGNSQPFYPPVLSSDPRSWTNVRVICGRKEHADRLWCHGVVWQCLKTYAVSSLSQHSSFVVFLGEEMDTDCEISLDDTGVRKCFVYCCIPRIPHRTTAHSVCCSPFLSSTTWL